MARWAPVRYARNGEVSIAYRTAGAGPIDLLFINGFISHLEIATSLARARRFWDRVCSFSRVIAFDKRGMGLSDHEGEYTLENVVDDALAVLDAIGLDRVAVFGISEGGSAATMLAATHADRVSAMVQYGTYARITATPEYPDGRPVELIRDAWDQWQEDWGNPATIDLWAPSSAGDPELREWWGQMERSGASPGTLRTMERMWEELDVRPLLPLVRAPTLVIYRSGDLVVPAALSRAVARGIPGAREVELPGRDHLFLAGDQDALLGEIEEFLTGRPAAAPSDRVLAAVLFTDLARSTEHAAELGDRRWRALLEQHEWLGRREVERFGGRLVKTMGDGLLATFDGPARAVRAALSIRAGSKALGLEMRAGVHAGECELIGDDVAGMAVHIAARVQSSAAPSEVIVSSTVKDLVVGSGLQFDDYGSHQLKGVPGDWQLFLVAGDAQRADGHTPITASQ